MNDKYLILVKLLKIFTRTSDSQSKETLAKKYYKKEDY